MNQKNIELQVKIGKLNINLQNRSDVTFSLFLSFAKKSKQIQKQKLSPVNQGQSYDINHTLRIDYDQLNLSKHKYCLLFIYEISEAGRKRVIGNAPINILVSNNQGVMALQLEECQDENATIQISVLLHYEYKQDDVMSNKASSLEKYGLGPLKQMRANAKLRFSEAAAKIHQDLTRTKSPESQLSFSRNSSEMMKFEYRSLRNQVVGPNRCHHLSPNISIIKSKEYTELPSELLQTKKVDSIQEVNSLVKIQVDHEEGVPQSEQREFARSSTSLEIKTQQKIVDVPNSQDNPDHNLLIHTFGTLGKMPCSAQLLPDGSKCHIESIKIDYMPVSHSEAKPILQQRQVISLHYKPTSSASSQRSLDRFEHFMSKHPPKLLDIPSTDHNRKNVVMSNLTEINTFTKHISALQERCCELINANEKLSKQTLNLRELRTLQRSQAQKQSEFLSRTIQQLSEKLRISESVTEQYFTMLQGKEQRIHELHIIEQQITRQNNDLKEKLKENSKLMHGLRLEVMRHQFNEDAVKNEGFQQKYLEGGLGNPSKSRLKIELEYIPSFPSFRPYARESERVLSNFYQTKRISPQTKEVYKSGKIVSNKSRAFPVSPYSQDNNSIPNSTFTNKSVVSKNNHFSQILPKTTKHSLHPQALMKGCLIDYLEIEKKNHSISMSRLANYQNSIDSMKNPKDSSEKKPYFLNKKYIKERSNEAKRQK